jgi:hypothetical protein
MGFSGGIKNSIFYFFYFAKQHNKKFSKQKRKDANYGLRRNRKIIRMPRCGHFFRPKNEKESKK